MTWTPLMSDAGHQWDGEAGTLAIGSLEIVQGAWASFLDHLHVVGASDMSAFRTMGKAAETAAYSLHVIGKGTLRVMVQS
jgi:hypothetical protein